MLKQAQMHDGKIKTGDNPSKTQVRFIRLDLLCSTHPETLMSN